jgi:cardiolipin synthase
MLNVPNILTILRIILIPVFIITSVYGRWDYSLYIFLGAAVTDKLDGMIARLSGTTTPLGSFLDPLADKFMLVTSFVVLTVYSFIPAWLAITVISRDIIIMIGWLLLAVSGNKVKVEPSRLGKLATATQFTFVTYVLVEFNYSILRPARPWLVLLTAALATASGLQYIQRGLKKIAGERKTGPKD